MIENENESEKESVIESENESVEESVIESKAGNEREKGSGGRKSESESEKGSESGGWNEEYHQ